MLAYILAASMYFVPGASKVPKPKDVVTCTRKPSSASQQADLTCDGDPTLAKKIVVKK